MSKRQGMRGFTLLEALIGFLILSIGMLGIASLQAVSLKAGKSSVYSSIVSMKIDELLESMRANPGDSNNPGTLLSYVGAAGVSHDCVTNTCSQAFLAEDEKFIWVQELNASLPGTVTSVVTVTPLASPSKMAQVNVAVSWSERNKEAASSVARSINITTNICTAMPC